MTYQDFLKFPDDEIFATGVLSDNQEGINMTGSGKGLRWVAVKGYARDWCVYTHWETNPIEFVREQGDKVILKSNILRCIICDEEMFNHYRR